MRAESDKTFMFNEPFARFTLSGDGVAQIIPETDRTFTIRAMKAGQVLMSAYSADGRVIHRSRIIVEQTQGYVKIYGTKKSGRDVADFIGFNCSSTSCGRADNDIAPIPDETSVSETQTKSDGGSVTQTKTYR